MEHLDYLKIDNVDSPDKAIVFIHGWKGNKDSFKSIVPLFKMPECAWYFPEGPYVVEENKDKRSWACRNKDGGWDVELTSMLLKNFLDDIILKQFKGISKLPPLKAG